MADANFEVQRLAELLAEANEQLARNGKVRQQTQDEITDAEMKAKYGIENFTKGTAKGAEALAALAGAGVESVKAMYEGKKGAGAFNSSLDELSKAATAAGVALTLLIPGGIVMKAVIGGLTMAATAAIAYTKAANDMADKLYKGYSDLAQSGAAASDGMTGVFNDAKKLGLSMNQLDSYVGLVAANSQELALMSGSVSQGRKEFAKVGEALESSRVGFFKMGITQEQQNEALMRYTKNQTLAGRAQNMTTKELADGARAYIYEQDKLTKLTGMNAQKQQALLDRARENEQFNAKLRKLELEGTDESLAAAERLKQGLQVAAMAGDESAEAFMASVNNNLRNDAARKANMSTSGAYLEYARDLESGAILDAAKGFGKVAKAGADYEKTIGIQRSMLDSGTDSQFKTSTLQKLALINQMGLEEAQKKIAADQLKQQQGQGDAITGQYSSLIKKQQDINKKLETDVFKGIPNAVANMNRLADVTDTLADGFSMLTSGINKLLNIVGLGVKEDKVEAKQTEIKGVEKELKTAQATQKTAKTPEEIQAADREVKFYTEKLALLKEEKKTISAAEENAAYEKEVLKRAEDEVKIKKAAYDKSMQTATLKQKLGFGLDADQKKAKEEYETADMKSAQLGLVGSQTRGAAVQELKSSKWKPTKEKDATAPQPASQGDQAPQSSQESLAAQGIKIKEGDVQKEGADLSPKIIDLAKNIQENIQGFSYFSGFNDNFHQEKSPSSKHTKGLAADFALDKKPSKEQGQELVTWLNKQGASLAIDEYNNPSSKSTAGHIHVEIPTFAEGGELAAGKLGIAGEAGPEFVQGPATITSSNDIMSAFNNMTMMIGQQTGAIDELIRIAKNGNDIQTKILRMQS
jgi:hypothetical protein